MISHANKATILHPSWPTLIARNSSQLSVGIFTAL